MRPFSALYPMVAAFAFSFLLLGAGSAPIVIRHPQVSYEALIVPSNSPVRFRRWDKYGYAEFDGKFTLTGRFTYGNNEPDYDGPLKESELTFEIEPDAALVARLPHWKNRHQDMLVVIERNIDLARAVTNRRLRAAIIAGKAHVQTGRISIVVDHFRTGLECDSANFTAHFVAVARAPKIAKVSFDGNYGCA